MALIFTMESIRYPILLWGVYTVPSYYSDLVRSGTAHWSYGPLVLQLIGLISPIVLTKVYKVNK